MTTPAPSEAAPAQTNAHDAPTIPPSATISSDAYIPGQSSTPSAFTKHYTQATTYLPKNIAARLPSAETAEQHVGVMSARLGVLSGSAADKAAELTKSVKGIDFSGKLTPETLTKCAWSVRNETQIALNVSPTPSLPLSGAHSAPHRCSHPAPLTAGIAQPSWTADVRGAWPQRGL